MKIVHLTSVHTVVDPRIVRKECATLARAGYEVTLVAAHDGPVPPAPIRIVTVPRPRGRAMRMTWTSFRIFLAALRQRADLYHLHDPELLPWGQLLRLTGKPVVFDMHENHAVDTPAVEWSNPGLGRLVAWLFKRLQPALLSGMAVVFAEDSYKSHYPGTRRHVAVRNLPLLDELLSIREPKNAVFTVAYMGAVSRDRGSLNTLRAIGTLKDRGHVVAFECIGPVDDHSRAEFLALAGELGLARFALPGFVEPGEGWRRVARCHVGLAVLRARPNYVESYPTKLFEYMALGLPVIVSDFPLYRSVLPDPPAGFCVDPDDPAALADAIEKIIRDPRLAQALGASGRSAVKERFNWTAEGEQLIRLYRELLSEPASRR
jgi:glycosyltransferase involved in cell wall biosynthesis